MGVLCCLLTVLIIRIHHKSKEEKLPKCVDWMMRKIIIPLSCWRGCQETASGCRATASCCSRYQKHSINPNNKGSDNKDKFVSHSNISSPVKHFSPEEEDVITNPNEAVDVFMIDKDTVDWPEVANIMDRFFFVLTIVVTTVMTVVFMFALALGGLANRGSSV